ncbi:hypothetical protein AKO1_002163 [Acrasis kona]|uniref:Uncharacterized protein n=1 Tax=Acrasis kona TaxID=1008807 RepID=A0AAW2Z9W7_9EUKA
MTDRERPIDEDEHREIKKRRYDQDEIDDQNNKEQDPDTQYSTDFDNYQSQTIEDTSTAAVEQEGLHTSLPVLLTNIESEVEITYHNERVEQARVTVAEINSRMEDLQNNFMSEISNIINKFLSDLSTASITRSERITKDMEKVEQKFLINVDKQKQMQHAKSLTERLYNEVGNS